MLLACNDCCGPPPCDIILCANLSVSFGCGTHSGKLKNATVSFKLGGVTVATCVTDATGVCCVTVHTAGTYTIHVDPPTGFVAPSDQTQVAVCGNTYTKFFTVTVASGYSCTSCCDYPIADTLTLTDASGSVTTTAGYGAFDNSFSDARVCGSRTCVAGVNSASVLQRQTATTHVKYVLDCNFTNTGWTLTATWNYGEYYTDCVDVAGSYTPITPDWAYGESFGAYWYNCFSNYYTVTAVASEAAGTLTVTSCADGSFALTATFPATVTSPVFGLTVDTPTGATVLIST